jgi:hypothetical protein
VAVSFSRETLLYEITSETLYMSWAQRLFTHPVFVAKRTVSKRNKLTLKFQVTVLYTGWDSWNEFGQDNESLYGNNNYTFEHNCLLSRRDGIITEHTGNERREWHIE